MDLHSPKAIKEIKDRYDFRFSKSLGQNFITDPTVPERITTGAEIGPEDLVIEIGPGIGVLTAEAARSAAKVVAIEIDKNLIPILSETLRDFDNVEVINRDILKTDLNQLIEEQRQKGAFTGAVRVLGNLPYYITTPIVMGILESGADVSSITVMMQKEVADRILAIPGSKTYGAISVAVQYYCEASRVLNVSKEAFMPKPQVDSTVLNLKVRKEKQVQLKDDKMFFACIKAGFGQRRKTLLNSLTGTGGLLKEDIRKVLEAAGIDASRRAETLTIEDFATIANIVTERIS